MTVRGPAPGTRERSELIEALAAPIKYARAQRLIAEVAAIGPFTLGELRRIAEIGEQSQRWEPARILFYQDLLCSVEGEARELGIRLAKLLESVRAHLVTRLWKSNNYPTARMYMDALRTFSGFSPAEVERIIAVMVQNKRIAGMRLEPRQFLFYRDLLAGYATQIEPQRLGQLVGILKTAVESDAALAQLKEG